MQISQLDKNVKKEANNLWLREKKLWLEENAYLTE